MTPPADEIPWSAGRMRVLAWGIGTAIAAGLVAFLLRGADQPKDPYLLPPGVETVAGTTAATGTPTTAPAPAAPAASRAPLPGFGETAIHVVLPSGTALDWCVLLADTEARREQGLMNVADPGLGGYDGMLFTFDDDTTVAFYMKDTPQPLSIAFVGSDGSFVGARDMTPCLGQAACPTYGPGRAYRSALEVPLYGLARLGIAEGSVVTDLGTPCRSS